jgi:hypothetical protein
MLRQQDPQSLSAYRLMTRKRRCFIVGSNTLSKDCVFSSSNSNDVTNMHHQCHVIVDVVGFIMGLAHNTFNNSINSMVHNIMWCMICTVWEFD